MELTITLILVSVISVILWWDNGGKKFITKWELRTNEEKIQEISEDYREMLESIRKLEQDMDIFDREWREAKNKHGEGIILRLVEQKFIITQKLKSGILHKMKRFFITVKRLF